MNGLKTGRKPESLIEHWMMHFADQSALLVLTGLPLHSGESGYLQLVGGGVLPDLWMLVARFCSAACLLTLFSCEGCIVF